MDEALIRSAKESDVPAILSMIRELAEFEKLLHEVTATEDRLRENLFGPKAAAEALMVETAGKAVGFTLFFHNFSTFLGQKGLYIEDIYVRPEHRGRGLGKKIFRALARIAAERNCGRMEWSVLDWNEKAIRFYRQLGAKPMDEWTVQRLTRDDFLKLL